MIKLEPATEPYHIRTRDLVSLKGFYDLMVRSVNSAVDRLNYSVTNTIDKLSDIPDDA